MKREKVSRHKIEFGKLFLSLKSTKVDFAEEIPNWRFVYVENSLAKCCKLEVNSLQGRQMMLALNCSPNNSPKFQNPDKILRVDLATKKKQHNAAHSHQKGSRDIFDEWRIEKVIIFVIIKSLLSTSFFSILKYYRMTQIIMSRSGSSRLGFEEATTVAALGAQLNKFLNFAEKKTCMTLKFKPNFWCLTISRYVNERLFCPRSIVRWLKIMIRINNMCRLHNLNLS